MQFGVTFVPGPPRDTVGWAQAAERHGFTHVGIADSQLGFRELWVTASAVACSTTRIAVGPRVTNAVSRHLSVTASAAATLRELVPGRTFLGVGSGDSAVRAIGHAPSSVDAMEQYVRLLRRLLAGESVDTDGAEYRLGWQPGPVPIYVAASGPRMLRMAGRVADGVILHSGLLAETVEWSRQLVAEGAHEAGRRLEDIDLWWFPFCYVGTREDAMAELASSLASAGNLLGRARPGQKLVPGHLEQALATLASGYGYESHVSGGTSANVRRMYDLGLADYLFDRFAIAGTAEECVEKITNLSRLGVDRLWLSVHFADKQGFLTRWHDEVMTSL